ncbi:N-acetyllactosaminide beta-1,3-N-acetylglucosaminyltransferase [Strongyloides ratti]|uniref:N-acetyllactosaminide beta-1,3-N-acetylglucosaminyltransferase n=1 Tax=Strongyloides ratti TaxID=34506 RepID=A0A090MUQ1_STRRB|nr:N-acetyllactosaminide beta-1,3-N-acetylglucosaminyltransferase [Strongyloides ratti]CEF62358.1 N-acetyllactosaminide beta-1,3-N-acetylglucosaminyltransferase [Strongyloides ratti]
MKFLFLLLIKLLFFNLYISALNNFTIIDSNVSSYFIKNFTKPFKSNFAWFYYKTFTVISNVIEGQKPEYLNSLTLALHVSNDRHLGGFKDRLNNWNDSISLGIYMVNDKVISSETECTICSIKKYLKDRKNVSVHLIFKKNLNISDDEMNYLKISSFCDNSKINNTQKPCVNIPYFKKINTMKSYPINTIRNVARKLAQSKFLIVTDSDQMFSPNFVEKVLPVVKKEYSKNKKVVFVIRVFETVSENYNDGPKNKKQLYQKLKKKEAFVFHHNNIIFLGTPKLKEWFKVVDNNKSSIQFEALYDNDAWEPKLIIPDDAPYHDESFPYPFRDNTVMRWSLCIENYKFLVLNNVFMYHLGIKSPKESKLMGKLRKANIKKYKNSRKNFTQRYMKKNLKRVKICMKSPNIKQKEKLLSDNFF